MSAFFVSKKHVDALVACALLAKPPGCAFGYSHHEVVREVDWETCHRTGRMLWAENLASIRSLAHGGKRPLAEMAQLVELYTYEPLLVLPTPIQGLKLIESYEYQSCEHEHWETSQALAYCAALRRALIAKLPGYEEADWAL